jgi:2'-5' RNA ligase
MEYTVKEVICMRLFVAVLFEEEIKTALYRTVEQLHSCSKSGTFTQKDNLHLTVNFIGETKRLEEVKLAINQAVGRVMAKPFTLSMGGLGKFKRREGDIYWVGVEREDTLWRLQKELVKELKSAGFFDIDDMEYTPHLTLGRRVNVKEGFQSKDFETGIVPMQMEVRKLSLMKSERSGGKLVYTEIYHVKLD